MDVKDLGLKLLACKCVKRVPFHCLVPDCFGEVVRKFVYALRHYHLEGHQQGCHQE